MKLNIKQIETTKVATFKGFYGDHIVYIVAKEGRNTAFKPLVQFFIGCEFFSDFKIVYEVPEGMSIDTEEDFLVTAHNLLFDNIDEILGEPTDTGLDYRTVYVHKSSGDFTDDIDDEDLVDKYFDCDID